MPDLRELIDDPEESLRAALAGLQGRIMTAMPGIVSADSPDGHTGTIQPAVKRAVADAVHNQITYQDFPLLPDVPIHFPGGGGMTLTHAVKAGDEIITAFSSHAFDFWHQNGGTQQPAMDRQHSATDAIAIPGIRSDPRKLHQVSTESAQLRSDDKKSVIDQHPTGGTHIKNVDPSTPVASATFDPFTAASKFFEHLIHPTNGVAHNATDGGTTHNYGLTHEAGHVMAVVNGLHSILAHPSDGAALTAKNLLHKVLAHPDLGALLSAAMGQHTVQAHPENGVMISSSTAVAISAPPGMLSLPSGGVSGDALANESVTPPKLAAGAAASNVGELGGDLAGELPNPQVVGIAHVVNANLLPYAANDAAAGALGVLVGGLYLNGTSLPGCNLVVARTT